MSQTCKVSVIIPNFTDSPYLNEAVDSVLAQSFEDFELILLISKPLLDSGFYFSNEDPRIKTISSDFKQLCGGALNNAINNAAGKYIAYLSPDDSWEKDKLKIQVEFLEQNPDYSACFTKSNVSEDINEDFSREEWIFYLFANGDCLADSSMLARVDSLKKIGGYKVALFHTFSYEIIFRLLYDNNIYLIKNPLVNKRVPAGKDSQYEIRSMHETQCIYYSHIKDMDDELFRSAFSSCLKNPDFSGHKEAMCEKGMILLLLNCCFTFVLLSELTEDDECLLYLTETCEFPLKDFYNYNTQPLNFDNYYFDLCQTQQALLDKLNTLIK